MFPTVANIISQVIRIALNYTQKARSIVKKQADFCCGPSSIHHINSAFGATPGVLICASTTFHRIREVFRQRDYHQIQITIYVKAQYIDGVDQILYPGSVAIADGGTRQSQALWNLQTTY